jgi:hypothetical protein
MQSRGLSLVGVTVFEEIFFSRQNKERLGERGGY